EKRRHYMQSPVRRKRRGALSRKGWLRNWSGTYLRSEWMNMERLATASSLRLFNYRSSAVPYGREYVVPQPIKSHAKISSNSAILIKRSNHFMPKRLSKPRKKLLSLKGRSATG